MVSSPTPSKISTHGPRIPTFFGFARSKNEAKSLTNLKYEGLPKLNYRCGDIISDVELHADSEYGTIFLQLLLVKKL